MYLRSFLECFIHIILHRSPFVEMNINWKLPGIHVYDWRWFGEQSTIRSEVCYSHCCGHDDEFQWLTVKIYLNQHTFSCESFSLLMSRRNLTTRLKTPINTSVLMLLS